MTGLNPGRHGVFAFHSTLNRDLERTFVNATAIQAPLLWERLSGHGLRVGVLERAADLPCASGQRLAGQRHDDAIRREQLTLSA